MLDHPVAPAKRQGTFLIALSCAVYAMDGDWINKEREITPCRQGKFNRVCLGLSSTGCRHWLSRALCLRQRTKAQWHTQQNKS